MADDLSTRDDLEQDANELKDGVKKATEPITDKIKDKAKDEISDRIGKHLADEGVKEASKAAAETSANATTAAAGATASEAAGGAATTSAGAAAGTSAGTVAGTTAAGTTGAAATGAAAGATQGAAAGAVGGPVGVAAGIVIGLAISLAKAAKNETDISIDNDDPNSPKINALIIIVFLFFFIMVFAGTLIDKGISSVFSIGQETEFEEDVVDGQDMAEAGNVYMDGLEGELPEYNYELPLKNTINLYTYGKPEDGEDMGNGLKDGFRAALKKAIDSHCLNIIDNLESYTGSINGHTYKSEKSLDSFYENRFPYDLGTEENPEPKIGDVLHKDGYDQEYLARYDDVNFAEVIAILSMSSNVEGSNLGGFTWGEANFEDFMDFTEKEECYENLYELGLKWVPVYEGEVATTDENGNPTTEHVEKDGDEVGVGVFDAGKSTDVITGCDTAPEEVSYQGTTLKFTYYYVRVTVKPFGLRELFKMAFGGDPVEAADANNVNFYDHSNLYMLEYSEHVTRMYQRDHKINIVNNVTREVLTTVDALGPSCERPRSEYSSVYEDVNNDEWLIARNWQGTGRSAWCYIETTYNDSFEVNEGTGDDTEVPSPPAENVDLPDGGKILNMPLKIKQFLAPQSGIKRGASNSYVKSSGCLDCSIDMILSYYTGTNISLEEICKYVLANKELNTPEVLAKYGYARSDKIYTNFINGVINEINNDRPALVHIKGQWYSSTGKKLHGTDNGHFFVIYGYDSGGFYVLDPGSSTNDYISYEDFGRVNDLYYRSIYKK